MSSNLLPVNKLVHLRLHPADVEAVAVRVVALLREEAPTTDFLSAKDVADMLDVSTRVVYDLAGELGAVRVGEGSKPRLRFPRSGVARYVSERSQARNPAPQAVLAPRPRRRRSRGVR